MANRIYNIIENYYSPMCGDWGNSVSCESSHGIIYPKCNFHCSFCNSDYHSKDNYTEYDEDTLKYKVDLVNGSFTNPLFNLGSTPRQVKLISEEDNWSCK